MPGQYRMGEYRLEEIGGNELLWEAHCGFMTSQKGRARVVGQVLFIGPPFQEEPGAIKGDFLDTLKHLPEWSRTRFYCQRAFVHRCDNGRRLTWDEMAALAATSDESSAQVLQADNSSQSGADSDEMPAQASLRLGGYEIVRGTGGSLRWRARSGSRSVKQGKAFILDDIIFLEHGMPETVPRPDKDFTKRLGRFPPWRDTTYFAVDTLLKECPVSTGRSQARTDRRSAKLVAGAGTEISKNLGIAGSALAAILLWVAHLVIAILKTLAMAGRRLAALMVRACKRGWRRYRTGRT